MEEQTDILRTFLTANSHQHFDLNALRDDNKQLLSEIITNPLAYIPIIQRELEHTNTLFKPTGSLGSYNLTPRRLNSVFLNKLISLEGIITSCNQIHPKIQKSVHYNKRTKKFVCKEYKDKYMIDNNPITLSVPQEVNGEKITFEYGLSEFMDTQIITMQEMPEDSAAGQMPRSVECYLHNMVDSVKPGDRVRLYGVFKSMLYQDGNGAFPSRFRAVMIVYNVEKIMKKIDHTRVHKTIENRENEEEKERLPEHLKHFAEIVKNDPIEILSSLIAPSVYGHGDIKKSLLLMLLSGTELQFRNGSRIRSSINILLIGDPSTAKSQLLRFISNLTNCVTTTGRGSSGVGLTACVTVDKETNERRLEAGALVLSDQGIVCIDEFDKMDDHDRVSLHEAMEQQTISISKAGINVTLNARASVLAAANPILGSYSKFMTLEKNIGLPESLLTRFDLIFVCIDDIEERKDTRIAEKVLNNHVMKKRELEDDDSSDTEDIKVNYKNISMLKDYIEYCKNYKPMLTKEAQKVVIDFYVQLRSMKNKITKVTPRSLETIIRLSSAHAKLRMSDFVDEKDVKVAIDLYNSSLNFEDIKVKKDGQKKVKIEEISFDDIVSKVTDALLIYKEMNNVSFMNLDDLIFHCDIEKEELVRVLEYLDKEEIIMFDGNNITFIN